MAENIMGIFESHAHYDDEAFNEDRRELLKELPEKGIEYVVNVGASMESTKSSIALAGEYDYIYAAVGDRKSTRLNSSHSSQSRMPSSA